MIMEEVTDVKENRGISKTSYLWQINTFSPAPMILQLKMIMIS